MPAIDRIGLQTMRKTNAGLVGTASWLSKLGLYHDIVVVKTTHAVL